jgi:pimeloyl-ACP methyl ester carboxylesterase
MRRSALALLIFVAAGASRTAVAQAQIAWTPCTSPAGYQCAQVPVPLDPSGATPGTITLSVKRLVAPANPTATAMVALAGGPGQAALPLATDFATNLKGGLPSRDFVVFDQRGTGASGALSCNALDHPVAADAASDLNTVIANCANQIGAVRALYTTAQSVADLEALRVAGGYSKLLLFGVSYGTKVAEAYAAAHPANVAGLILDSVVTPTGPDLYQQSTFAAIPRVLSELCAGGACRRATPSVRADLATIVARTHAHAIRGTLVTPTGGRARLAIETHNLIDLLLAGDFNPALRAELPAALHSARNGDSAPLIRLVVQGAGINGIKGFQATGIPDEDETLFIDTTCEEDALPWARTVVGTAERLAAERAAFGAIAAATVAPFSTTDALHASAINLCVGWPSLAPVPPAPGPLPAVPTLILEGQADLRTTVADAQALAAQIPGSTLITVPHSGHSVLGSDLSGCAQKAVDAYFAGTPLALCAANTPNTFTPVPLAPTSLKKVTGSNHRLKTALAAAKTVADMLRQLIGASISAGHPGGTGSKVGGLRGGYARVSGKHLVLVGVTYIPGVKVSGSVTFAGSGTLRVSGSSADAGTIKLSSLGTVNGRLGGRKIHAHFSSAHASAARWPGALPHPLVR